MSFLTQKMGPLPIWGWGALAAGGTFLVLKSGGKKSAAGGDPNNPNGTGTGSTLNEKRNITATSTSNTNSTWDGSNTWGGGNLGFLMGPMPSFGNFFVHMHHDRDRGGWFSGGRRYNGHGFEGHGWKEGGHRGGGDDGGRGGDRGGNRGGSRGGGRGRGGNGGGFGAIARSFGPNSSRYRDNNQSSPGNYSRNDTLPTGAGAQGRGSQR